MLCLTSPTLGIDGVVSRGTLPRDQCCPPTICEIDYCGLACNFVNLLPSGPLWDIPKRTATTKATQAARDGCSDPICVDNDCTSIVAHAVYVAAKLHDVLFGALWPALRESNPATAFDTLDSWLDLYGWESCWKCGCDCEDEPGAGAPFDLIFPNGRRICCPDEAPAGLDRAVKKGIVIALHRLRLGIVPNVASINFVISSLGAQIAPSDCIDGGFASCDNITFDLTPTGYDLPAACLEECPRTSSDQPIGVSTDCWSGPCCDTIKAYWNLKCDGQGDGRPIFPGLLAAQCIVRSILPDPSIIIRRVEPEAR